MPTSSRRDVLRLLVVTPVVAFASPVSARAAVLHLRAGSGLAGEAKRGLEFGVKEAAVAARLLGLDVQLDGQQGAAEPVGVVAPGISVAPPAPPGVPLVALAVSDEQPPDACTFRVAATAAQRRDALDRWRARSGGSASGDGELQAVEWHHSLKRYGASEVNERFTKETGTAMTPEAWVAWFAVKALVENALRGSGPDLCERLGRGRFDGHKGRVLSFSAASRTLVQPLYVIRPDGRGGTVLGEV